jgi:hypothetical protein
MLFSMPFVPPAYHKQIPFAPPVLRALTKSVRWTSVDMRTTCSALGLRRDSIRRRPATVSRYWEHVNSGMSI